MQTGAGPLQLHHRGAVRSRRDAIDALKRCNSFFGPNGGCITIPDILPHNMHIQRQCHSSYQLQCHTLLPFNIRC